jgi:hypothetical protein
MSYKTLYKKVLGHKLIDKTNIKKSYIKNKEGKVEREIIEDKLEHLNNSLLIIDEVHNTVGNTSYGNEWGNAINELIKKSYNLKLILLSATPMINSAYEIINIINYMRPINDKILRDSCFNQDTYGNIQFSQNGK